MTKRILIVNPNSTRSCTDAIDRAAEPYRAADVAITAETIESGPASVVTMEDYARAQANVAAHFAGRNAAADAIVVACFSDPGVPAAHEITGAPCFGIGEAAIYAAMQRGYRFGVVALGPASVQRQRRRMAELGVAGRYAGSRVVNLSVPELANADRTADAMAAAARRLAEEDGADAVIMGCAGMGAYRGLLADAVGPHVAVIEPTQAALAAATGAVRQGW